MYRKKLRNPKQHRDGQGAVENLKCQIAYSHSSVFAELPRCSLLRHLLTVKALLDRLRSNSPVLVLLCVLGMILAAANFQAQAPEQAPSQTNRYQYRSQHDRDGIGKFYMGREIAQVMTCHGANWLDRPERQKEEDSDQLIEFLAVKPGEIIADMGAGTGYFSIPLAQLVGPHGRVLAVDIQPEMLDILKARMKERGVSNVDLILGNATDPHLPDKAVDLVLMVDIYHELSHPWEMMQKICEALKPGGRVALVEYRAEDPSVPIKRLHKMTEGQVIKEMAEHPLFWQETINILPRQHVIIFQKSTVPQ